jgi:predicted 2-oxoglutarate/Fe(II)-dependent dioxygenase YbiX
MEHANVAPGIMLFTNVWEDSNVVVQSIENVVDSSSMAVRWKRALVGTGLVERSEKSAHRTNSSLVLDSSWAGVENETLSNAGKIGVEIRNKIQECLNQYLNTYPLSLDPLVNEMIVLKYQTGQEYKMHADAGGGNRRVVSVVMYLNDNYTGGNIEFPHFKYDLKPPANSMIFFPSNYIYSHIAHPVQEGTKYAVVTWITEGP